MSHLDNVACSKLNRLGNNRGRLSWRPLLLLIVHTIAPQSVPASKKSGPGARARSGAGWTVEVWIGARPSEPATDQIKTGFSSATCPSTRHKTVAQLVQTIRHRVLQTHPGLESRRPRSIERAAFLRPDKLRSRGWRGLGPPSGRLVASSTAHQCTPVQRQRRHAVGRTFQIARCPRQFELTKETQWPKANMTATKVTSGMAPVALTAMMSSSRLVSLSIGISRSDTPDWQ
jgi:hypothetical protein